MRLRLDYDDFLNKIHDYDYDYDYSLFVIDYNRLRLLEVCSRHVSYTGHQNTAPRIGIRLKRLHCVILISSFIVQRIKVTVSLYVALSRKSEVMVAELADHVTIISVDVLYEQKLGVLQKCLFPD